jgi:hypothetical protein
MSYRKFSEETSRIQDQDIARLFLEGVETREISEKVGLAGTTVRRRIARMQRTGLPVLSRKDRNAVHYEVRLEQMSAAFVRFAILSTLNGAVHDSLVAEQRIMLTARERAFSTPIAAVGDERELPISAEAPNAESGDDKP